MSTKIAFTEVNNSKHGITSEIKTLVISMKAYVYGGRHKGAYLLTMVSIINQMSPHSLTLCICALYMKHFNFFVLLHLILRRKL